MQLFVVDPVCMLYGSFTVLSGMDLCMQQMLGESGNFRGSRRTSVDRVELLDSLANKASGHCWKKELPRGGY